MLVASVSPAGATFLSGTSRRVVQDQPLLAAGTCTDVSGTPKKGGIGNADIDKGRVRRGDQEQAHEQ